MSNTRHDIIVGRQGKDGKTYWTNIGSAWPSEKGGMSCELSALPIPDHEGRVRMLIVTPKSRDERSGTSISDRAKSQQPANNRPDMDDDIPF